MAICLDRFAQDIIIPPRQEEPETCWWCGEDVYGGNDIHEKCQREHEIQEMPFAEVLNMVLERVTDTVEVSGEDNWIRFDCWFKTLEDTLEVIEILEARDATYYATKDHVSFQIGAGSNWRLEFK